MTFGQALQIHKQNQADDVRIKPSTRHYWNQVFAALLKDWSGSGDREMRRITRIDCAKWARRFRKKGFPTTYNNTLAGLRHVFDVAIETGIIYRNPSAKLERVAVRAKQLTLPTREQFLQLVRLSNTRADGVRAIALIFFEGWRSLNFGPARLHRSNAVIRTLTLAKSL